VFSRDGLLDDLKKVLVGRSLTAGQDQHLARCAGTGPRPAYHSRVRAAARGVGWTLATASPASGRGGGAAQVSVAAVAACTTRPCASARWSKRRR